MTTSVEILEMGQTYRIADLPHAFRAMPNSHGQILLVNMNYAPEVVPPSELKELSCVEFFLVNQDDMRTLEKYEVSQDRGKRAAHHYQSEYTLGDVAACEVKKVIVSLND